MLPLAPGTVGKAAGITVMDVAAVVWLAVSAGMMLMHLYSYFRFRARIVRKGSCVEEKLILEKLFILEEELGIKKSIPVIKCRDAASPMIIGFFRPLLVIPESTYGGEELFFMLKRELIHLKRHDTFFKLLFVAARAVHWFNPVVALLQRVGVIDMELACDEKVIVGMSHAERMVYTETLLAAVGGGPKKTKALTTQFYGGKKIMKMRFENILRRSAGRQGVFLLTAVICMTLAAGMMTGCAVTQTEFAEESGEQTGAEREAGGQETLPGEAADEAVQETLPGEAADEAVQETLPGETADAAGAAEVQDDVGTQGVERVALSAEAMEISEVATAFSMAYFEGDREEIREYLADSYDDEIEVYTDADRKLTGMIAVKGLEDIGAAEVGDTQSISLECSMADAGEGFLYLTLEMVKQEDGWKIDFYGLEM